MAGDVEPASTTVGVDPALVVHPNGIVTLPPIATTRCVIAGARWTGDVRGAAEGERTLIDQAAGPESIEPEPSDERMCLPGRNGMRHGVTARRNGLEPAGPPSTVDIQPLYRGRSHEGTGVGCDVDPACP